MSSELASRFGLDINFDEKEGANGPDLADVKRELSCAQLPELTSSLS